jgi:hypothetical protein
MITKTGKEIIAKYLMGTAPAYASYISLGCGTPPRPLVNSFSGVSSSGTTITVSSTVGVWIGAVIVKDSGTGTLAANSVVTEITGTTTFVIDQAPLVALSSAVISITPNQEKSVMDFEMFRVPITSRGYVSDNGVNKIVLTAELPTEERYEISEIGVFSAGSNADAGRYDSKTIYTFSDIENWQFSDDITLTRPAIGSSIFPIINASITTANNITSTADAIQTNSNNVAFLDPTRAGRYERCRYLNNIILLRGDTSMILADSTVATGSKHLQITGQSIDFTRNSTADILKIALSLVSVTGASTDVPTKVRVLIEFSNDNETQYAKFLGEAESATSDMADNRYMVMSKRLDELTYSPTFSWNSMTTVKVYVSAIDELVTTIKELISNIATITSNSHEMIVGDVVIVDIGDPIFDGEHIVTDVTTNTFSYAKTNANITATGGAGIAETPRDEYMVSLDAIRLDNVGTVSPLYGMTGYSVVQNDTEETIIKDANTNNYIEFRIILDVT